MDAIEPPKSDEARKIRERAEYYIEKIRKRELRFTPEAESTKCHDLEVKDMSLPSYVARCMAEYDREKVDGAEYAIKENRKMVELTELTSFLIARNISRVIDEALTSPNPLIEEGEAFFSKLEVCEKERKTLADERDRLDAELEKLSAEAIGLQALYEECQRKLHIQPLGDKRTKGEGGF